jgi:hypothetical protein
MHNLVELSTAIIDALVEHTGKPVHLRACIERYPDFRTYIVLADHGENSHGTRYLVTEENGTCTVQEIAFLTPKLVWSLSMQEKEVEVNV